MGIPRTTFKRWYKNEQQGIPVGQKLKGQSTLYKEDGSVSMRWVKTTADAEAQQRMLMAAFAGIRDEIPRYEPLPRPKQTEEDLLACYIMTDLHLGMLAEKQECGDDWNIDIAQKTVRGW
jgi:hypothetical protein